MRRHGDHQCLRIVGGVDAKARCRKVQLQLYGPRRLDVLHLYGCQRIVWIEQDANPSQLAALDRIGRLIAAYSQKPSSGHEPIAPADPHQTDLVPSSPASTLVGAH